MLLALALALYALIVAVAPAFHHDVACHLTAAQQREASKGRSGWRERARALDLDLRTQQPA